MRFAGFIGPSYVSQSVNVDCQRCVNLFTELDELGTGKEREVASLVPTPGKKLLLTLPGGVYRGSYTSSQGVLYAVGGNKFYSISSAWVATELGSLNTSTGPVDMADNGTQVCIVDGTYVYGFTIAGSVFAQVTLNTYASDRVTFQDGYFILNRKGTKQFYLSDLYALTFNALDIASAEGSPDNLIGQISDGKYVYLCGASSLEVWYDSGDAAFPFTRMQGALSDVGCAAAFSIAKIGAAIFFLGGDETGTGIVYQVQGVQTKRISTPAVESVIRKLDQTLLSTARAWVYTQGGHQFYCLNLPGAASTWVYDASTSMWHERTYLGSWGFERDRADGASVAYGKIIVGDYANGRIYQLDPDTITDNGTPIVRDRVAPHISQDMANIFHHSFQLDMEVGVGLDGTQNGTDPQAILRWSDDGGHTWSNERFASIGKIGQTKVRVFFRRLGCSRDRVYWFRIADPVKVTLIGAELGLEQGVA